MTGRRIYTRETARRRHAEQVYCKRKLEKLLADSYRLRYPELYARDHAKWLRQISAERGPMPGNPSA